MRVTIACFQTHKFGNTAAECEDAYALSHYRDMGPRPYFRCAIADGATESAYAEIWAKGLVEMFSQFPQQSTPTLTQVLQSSETVAKQWRDQVWAKPLPWFAVEKVQRGAFATLLGLQLDDSNNPTGGLWHALAIGDSILFHIRDNRLLKSFPLESSDQFNNRPLLLASDSERNTHTKLRMDCAVSGEWTTGDRFLLITDAIACWALSQVEAEQSPWDKDFAVDNLANNELMTEWTQRERNLGKLKNDDVTILSITVEKES